MHTKTEDITKEIKSSIIILNNRNIITSFNNIEFTSGIWKKEKDKKGNIKRYIIFNKNIKSTNLFIKTLIHELTHDIIGSKAGQKLQKEIIYFLKYQKKYINIKNKLYKYYNKYLIDEEIVAITLSNNIGTKNFINRLITEKTTTTKKIYYFVIDKINIINKIFKYKNKKLFWMNIKNNFINAYNSDFKETDEFNCKYLKGKLTNGEDVIISDDVIGTHPTVNQAKKVLYKMLGISYKNNSNGKYISIEKKDINKYLHDGYNNQKNNLLKKRISGNYGEILEIAKITSSKTNYKNTNRGKQGFDYYSVNLAYPIKDVTGKILDYRHYEARLVVRKDSKGNFAYDLDGFKEKKKNALNI